jgi:hypothetical protein
MPLKPSPFKYIELDIESQWSYNFDIKHMLAWEFDDIYLNRTGKFS